MIGISSVFELKLIHRLLVIKVILNHVCGQFCMTKQNKMETVTNVKNIVKKKSIWCMMMILLLGTTLEYNNPEANMCVI